MTPTCVSIPATELEWGDYIEGEGVVVAILRTKRHVSALLGSGKAHVFDHEQRVRVHIEDHGEEE